MTDVVIAALPYVETQEPLMAPALLKGVVSKAELSCFTFDFNIEVVNQINQHFPDLSERISRWFLYQDFQDCQETQNSIDFLVEYVAQKIVAKNPQWICLSLFCNTAKQFNIKLCKVLRKLTTAKIVIGGNAVFTDDASVRPYAKILLKAKMIDHYIVGDGEEPLYDLLTGQVGGTNQDQFQIFDDLSKQPYANYDDYDWSLYKVKRLPMYTSRGCVRRCTFCDVYKLWKKFKIRTAEDAFNEMLYQIEKTGITNFYFRDSLINGSISEFRKLMQLIANYNDTHDEQIKWTSFFIFRPQVQMGEQDWELASRGGANNLIIGVESLVDSIRYHMRKKFTNKDIDFGLQMAKKYGIELTLLLIVGYVNETEEDFQSALKWLDDHVEYSADPIHAMSVGGTLTVTDLTDLYQNAEDFDITLGEKIYLWENKKIGLDYATREKRKEKFIQHARSLGYNILTHEKPVG